MPMNAHDFFFSIPPVTRTVVGACIATTFLTSINAVSPLRLYLYFSSVFAGEVRLKMFSCSQSLSIGDWLRTSSSLNLRFL